MANNIVLTICAFLFGSSCLKISAQVNETGFTYIEIDSSKGKWGDFNSSKEWLRYFGLGAADVNYDGHKDVLSGRYVYLNPQGTMEGEWKRIDLGINVDGMLFTDIDGDEFIDIIGEDLPNVYWMEAANRKGTAWTAMKIGELPPTEHQNGQGYGIADVVKGGKPEIILTAGGGLYYAQIPQNKAFDKFEFILAAKTESEEDFVAYDINEDGHLDLISGDNDDEEISNLLYAYLNPGDGSGDWKRKLIGKGIHAIDRVKMADFDADGDMDIAIAEERWPGKEPDAHLIWFECPDKPLEKEWERHMVVQQFSMNNLDVGDLDNDGDTDMVTNEHKGTEHKTWVFYNDGKGDFTPKVISMGQENHLGTQLYDLDGDGDLDIIGQGWQNHKKMHVWRNDLIKKSYEWQHLSSSNGEIPLPNGGDQQTSNLVADLNGDGINDFIITDRKQAPSVVGYLRNSAGWEKFIIDPDLLKIEAGSAIDDIDNDGDMDIVFGGDSSSNEVWWWENPGKKSLTSGKWERRFVKNSGENKHHDQMFIDVDADGTKELVFWNQGANKLTLAKKPKNLKKADEWPMQTVYSYQADSEMQQRGFENYPRWKANHEHEGLWASDIDQDGTKDIVGGGLWFKYSDGKFLPNVIDASYTFSRSAAGQLIKGGRPEVVMVVGDGKAPMYLYQYIKGSWQSKLLIPELENGHTLEIVDFDGDGNMDIFSAEMRFGEGNPDSKIRILLGDGTGSFSEHIVKKGMAVHEGKIADLDGDGDYDILAKPYKRNAPRVDVYLQKN